MLLSVLIIHIVFGAVGLLAGYAVIFVAKGNKSHKYLGRAYAFSMLVLGVSGTYIAVYREVPLSMLNGLVLCYFVLSSSSIVWQPQKSINYLDKLLLAFAVAITIGFVWFSYQATQTVNGKLGGFGVEAYIVFGSVMVICCVADYLHIKRGGLSGKKRLVRHLWRMFFPLFMSTAAFFLGQAKHLPQALQKIEILISPVILVIISAFYWSYRVGKSGYKRKSNYSME